MILFKSDWARYPRAIIDTKTTNASFIRLASVYKSMGVENHAFPLALLNPDLQGVDPFSPTLTIEQMAMISLECKHNPWYFFREIAKAPKSGGNDAMRLQANRGNIALYWLFFNHITQFLIQPRQTGKSFSTDALMVLLLTVICIATKINLLTKNDNLRRANVRRLKEMLEELPPYLMLRARDDANNTEEITINALGNRYDTHVPQSSPKRADNMGRGLTTAVMHVDEAPFQENIEIALKAALPAMTAAIEAAKIEGAPYGTIFTTTAGKIDDRDGAFIYQELMDSAPWTEMFLDCDNLADLETTIRTNSRGGKVRVRGIFNHRQLGKTDEWMLRALEDSFQEGDSANRDFFNMWTSGSQTNPIPIVYLERIAGSRMEHKHIEVATDRYITRWYIPGDEIHGRMANGKFALVLDTSEAIGKDDIGMLLIDLATTEVVASGTFNETNLIKFSRWLLQWFVRFENITGIIERRSTGGMIMDYLIVYMLEIGMDPFKRLFNTVVQDFRENPEQYDEIRKPLNRRDPRIYDRFKKTFGFSTSGGDGTYSRNGLYSSTLMMAAKRGCDYVYDVTLADQISKLINKNGRVDHPQGGHDDMVIAWLLGFWFMTKAVNVSFYGIDSRILMSKNQDMSDPQSLIPDHQQKVQLALREKIENLTEELGRERDKFVAQRLEQEVRSLMKHVVVREDEIYSVDELLRTAKEKRVEKRRFTSYNASPYQMGILETGNTMYRYN